MAKIIGYVKIIDGIFKAESKDGTIRILKVKDPVYEEDAIFGGDHSSNTEILNIDAGVETELNYISIGLNDGRDISLTSEDYLLFDTSVLGQNFDIYLFEEGTDAFQYPQHNGDDQGAEDDASSSIEAVIFDDVYEPITPYDMTTSVSSLSEDDSSRNFSNEQNQRPGPSDSNFFEHQSTSNHPSLQAESDHGNIEEDVLSPVTGNVVSNDNDPGGNTLEVIAVNGLGNNVDQTVSGNYGSLTINADGSYSYLLDNSHPNVQGLNNGDTLTDTFTYTVDNGHGDRDSASLTITINGTNDAPVAVADSNTIAENSHTITGNILVNDSDIDNSASELQISAYHDSSGTSGTVGTTSNTQYGSIILNTDGSYTYTVDNSNPAVNALDNGESLTEVITYTVSDGNGGTDTATLTITINGTNDAPVVDLDSSSSGTSYQTTFVENGSAITIADSDSSITDPDDSNMESATIVLTNAQAGDSLDVSGVDGSFNATVDTSVAGQITVTLSGSHSKADYADAIEAITFSNTSEDPSVVDRVINITTSDGTSNSNTAVSTIHVTPVNDAPVAVNDSNQITENSTVAVTGDILSNDSDVDGGTLSIDSVDGNGADIGRPHVGNYGSVTINSDGTYSYQVDNSNPIVQALEPGDSISDTFTYTVSDGNGGTDTATLTITINGTNDAPVVDLDSSSSGTSYQTTFVENGSAIAIADSDSSITDPDDSNMESATIVLTNAQAGDSLDISGVDGSFNAIVDTSVAGQITVTLSGSHTKADYADAIEAITFSNSSEDPSNVARNIEVTTSDGSLDSNTAVSTIYVIPVNDAPVTASAFGAGDKDDTYIPITLSGTDVDSSVSDFRIITTPANGTLYSDAALTHPLSDGDTVIASGNQATVYFKPDYGPTGAYGQDHYNPSGDAVTFTYAAKDSDPSDGVTYGNTATATITVDDVPYAAAAADREVVENYTGSTLRSVSGNVLTDGSDFDSGVDYQSDHGDNPAEVHMVQFADASGNYSAAVNITTGTDQGSGNYSFTTDYGTLTINADGSYTFTPDGSIDHTPSGDDVDFKFRYAILDQDGDLSNYAEQIIHIHDGEAPTIGTPTDVVLNEKDLPNGTDPHPVDTEKSGDIDATVGTDEMDVRFDTVQTELDSKIAAGLSSGGHAISYSVSADGHTLTAQANGNDIFSVTITNPHDNSCGYDFQLLRALDHEAAVVDGDDGSGNDYIDFSFNVTAADSDDASNDFDSDTFNVRVIDDNPATQNESTNEETAVTFNTNADASGSNTTVYDGTDGHPDNRPEHGTAVVNADGTITYTPTPGEDYSGPDSFIYTTTLDDGTVTDTTVNLTVNPVADVPTWDADKTGSNELQTNEDTLVDLNLTLPNITDNIDRDGGTGAGADEPEHLGLITLAGVADGAKIYLSDGTTLVWESTAANNGTATIRIDDDTNTWSSTDLHYDGISGEDILLTPTEFQGLKLLPPEDSGQNLNGLTLSVQSYEVDSTGNPIAGVSPSAAATQHIDIDVQAVTDNITLTKLGDASGDEDSWIRIDDKISVTHGDNSDGSEQFVFKIDGADLTAGTRYRVDGGASQDASSGIVVSNYVPGSTRIEILSPPNDSNDISGMTITVEMTDTDSDSGGVIATLTDSIDIDINVDPVANDLTVSGGGSGNEDSLIDMGMTFGGGDGNEEIEYVTIAGIPDGARVYESDGSTLVFTGDGSTDLVVDVTGVDPAGETRNDTLTAVSGYKILPPQDSNADFSLDVTINTRDYDDDTPSTSVTGSYSETIDIQVAGVVDTSAGDQDTADTGHLYVELGTSDGNVVTGDATVTDLGHVAEDSAVDLHAAWQSYETVTNGTADGSEEATFLIRNVTDSTSFTVVDGSGNVIGSQTAEGWELNTSQLSDAHILAQDNFSGELNLELVTTVTESGDDPAFDENTQIDKFRITFDPVTDSPSLLVREVFTQEDTSIVLDIRPISADTDGSEHLVSVEIENIPDGAALKLADGTTVWLNDSGGTASHTFIIHDTSTNIETRATDASDESNITADNLYNLHFTPPAHASGDINLQVTSTMQDGAAAAASTTQSLTVHVQGVADTSILNLEDAATGDAATGIRVNGSDIGDGGNTVYNDGDTVVVFGQERVADSDGAIPIAVPNASGETVVLDVASDMTPSYPHAAYAGDTSEALSFVLEGVPDDFRIVDGNGDAIGNFVTLSGGTTTWTLTASEVENGVYIKAPVDYSGVVDDLKYTCIVTEEDGHTSTRELPFSLEINPVISTLDPIQDVSGVEDAAPDGTDHGTLVDLNFSHVADTTGSEVISQVTINDADLPDGLELYVQDGGNWVRADSLSAVYDGTTYDLSNYVDRTAVGVVGATLENVAGTFTIDNVLVTVTDGNENGNTATVTQNFSDSISITLDGVADLPALTASGTDGLGNVHDVNIDVVYPDDDGSESHYITIDTPGSGYLFNHGEQTAPDQWQFTPDEMAGLQVEVPDDTISTFIVRAYAVENNTEVATATFDITDTSGGGGGSGTHTPQDPSLAISTITLTPDEDSSFSLNAVVDGSNTHLNDNDGGSEILSFVIRDLADGSAIVSTDAAISINQITDPGGDTIYTFSVPNGMTVDDALSKVEISPPTDFSGDFDFTVEAVATETADTFNSSAIVGSNRNAHVEVQPVADTFTLDTSTMTTTIIEDSMTQVKFSLASSDNYSDGDDHPEMVYYDGLGGSDMVKISVDSGNFVFSDGSQIEADNDIDVRVSGGIVQYDAGGGNWQDVYFKAPDQESGSYDITVKAYAHDTTDFASGSSTTSTSGEQTRTITVTVNPDPDAADEAGDPNADNDTITATNVTTNEDTAVQLHINVEMADTDGSELHAIVVTGLPSGSILQDSSGNLVGTNSGDGSWALSTAELADLYLLTPQNYSGTLDLSVENRVIETGNMTVQSVTSADFSVTVAAVADGAIISPHNSSGNEDEYIAVDLEASSIEAEQNASSAVENTPPGNEHYQLTFDEIDVPVQFYWRDSGGVFQHLADENSADSSDYLINNLTQEQVDNLHVVIGNNLTGTFNFGAHVATQEIDGNGDVINTSATEDATITITANAVSGDDVITGTDADDTLYGHSGNDTIDGGNGADTIYAGSGDDTITFDSADTIDGGTGEDTLILSSGGSITFDATATARLDNIEQLDLNPNGDHTIDSLSINDLIDMTDNNNELTILGDASDNVNLQNGDGGEWVATGTVAEGGHTFNVYDLSTDADTLTLKVEETINLQIV